MLKTQCNSTASPAVPAAASSGRGQSSNVTDQTPQTSRQNSSTQPSRSCAPQTTDASQCAAPSASKPVAQSTQTVHQPVANSSPDHLCASRPEPSTKSNERPTPNRVLQPPRPPTRRPTQNHRSRSITTHNSRTQQIPAIPQVHHKT